MESWADNRRQNADAPASNAGRPWCGVPMRKLIVIATVAAGLCLVIWGLSASRDHARAHQCSRNLRQIGLALQNYHDTYKCFPAAYYTDDAGVPLHSWRIRVLPYLEQSTIPDSYHFDEPWNSRYNLAVGRRGPKKFPDSQDLGSPRPFFCPLEPGSYEQQKTSYAMIVGPGTAFHVGRERRMDQFPDGAANTIIVAEIDHDRMHWLEPRDLHVERMSFRINDQAQPSISSQHPQGPAVLFADGRVFRLSPSVSPTLVEALITVEGGESISRLRLINDGQLR